MDIYVVDCRHVSFLVDAGQRGNYGNEVATNTDLHNCLEMCARRKTCRSVDWYAFPNACHIHTMQGKTIPYCIIKGQLSVY